MALDTVFSDRKKSFVSYPVFVHVQGAEDELESRLEIS